jgi:hypothetical protein
MLVGTAERIMLFVLFAMLIAKAAGGAITVECVPVGSANDSGGQIVEVECFLTTMDMPQTFSGVQLDFPCLLPGKPEATGGVSSVSITVEFPHLPEPHLLEPVGGNLSINHQACTVAFVPVLSVGYVTVPPNSTVYLATAQYVISSCAAGNFNIILENHSEPPESSDSTRFLASNGIEIPFDVVPASVIILTGTCCQSGACVAEDLNDLCCSQTYPGASFFPGRSCADVLPCGLCTSNSQCDDSDFCNGPEACDSIGGDCVPGTPPDCADGVFCNGQEICDPETGCLASPPPCAQGLECDEERDECFFPGIPTVSAWGLAALSLCLAIGAKVRFSRPTCG